MFYFVSNWKTKFRIIRLYCIVFKLKWYTLYLPLQNCENSQNLWGPLTYIRIRGEEPYILYY